MRVYVSRGSPRTVLLGTSEHVLSFRSIDPNGSLDRLATVVVELQARSEVNFGGLDALSECFGCLGLINAGSDVFLCVINDRSKAAQPTPRRTVWNIHSVEFISLRKGLLDTEDQEHPCFALKKFIGLGGFLYSSDFDLTARAAGGEQKLGELSAPVDASYMWNQFMTKGLNQFRDRLSLEDKVAMDEAGFLTTLIRGFASTIPITLSNVKGTLTVLSRQSWLRAGTRYNSRGIDDDGNVANFVESETVLWLQNGVQFGFNQLRGSVPLFWEQDSQLLTAKISLTRPIEATEPAFRRHINYLVERFGAVHIVDLLGSSTGSRGNSTGKARTNESSGISIKSTGSGSSSLSSGVGPASETDVSLRYQTLVERVPALRYTHFDFHKEVAGVGYSAASKLIDRIQDSMLEFGFYSYNPSTHSTETEQIGVFRVNCLDCLDRTNLVQQLVSKDALDLFLDYHELYGTEELWNAHAVLWADNGDQLSQNYTGTGALKSSYTRSGRMNLAGALSDVSKSVSRLYINNFVDKTRQSAIDEILGRAEGQVAVKIFDPINDHVRKEMKQRAKEYQSESLISVFAGTFNVNGKTFERKKSDGLESWLFPKHVMESEQYPDLYVIGFQELVELTASQVLNVDPTRKTYWEEIVGQCLNSRGQQYVLLRSGQLVGTALMMFVKRSHMPMVTEVEGTSKKTALSGITGNKGGVAIGFKYASTRFIVVNSHMAAGMNALEDRHSDYKILSSGLRFSGNRRVKDADIVIWLGDLNYRVDLPNDTVRKLIEHRSREESIATLMEHDQLSKQMERGETFPYFNESKITFLPTYKFDPGTSVYDTSDKQRVPAWTDRILMRGQQIKQIAYNSVPQIRFSDHRPVYALYDITVAVVDEEMADQIYSQLYDQRRHFLITSDDPNYRRADAQNGSHNRVFPSSETKKWWAGPGMHTKIEIQPPHADMVLNPDKINPFGSLEPDFIQKPTPPPSRHTSPSQLVSKRSGSSISSGGSAANIPASRNGPNRKHIPSLPVNSHKTSGSLSPNLMDTPILSTEAQKHTSSNTSVGTLSNSNSTIGGGLQTRATAPAGVKSNQNGTSSNLMDANDEKGISYKSLL